MMNWITNCWGDSKLVFLAIERIFSRRGKLVCSHPNRQSARPALERKKAIENLVSDANFCGDPFARAFHMNMNLQMMKVNGRVLDQQRVLYDTNQSLEVTEGVWDCGKGGLKFFQPASCTGYSLISFINDEMMLQKFCGNLLLTCDSLGMHFPMQWPDVVKYIRHPGDLEQAMKACLEATRTEQNRECQLILVVMRTKNPEVYSEVKRWGEIELGVMTQVMLEKNARTISRDRSSSGATAVNVAMKINMKLGGINNGIRADQVWNRFRGKQNAALFLGIDVTHPNPEDRTSPSIGAVVGNVDFEATKYGASIKVQSRRREHMVYLQDTVKERLLQYFESTKEHPKRIIAYRDGVSQGQFIQVLKEEMGSIRSACEQLNVDYKPDITYIVVQKRHHTRLFCRNGKDAVGKAQNVPPGTVVDTTITHPCEFDFYLCSHFGIQGTSRPTHYYVLHNACGFSADELQMVTYQLCHLYGRCTRVVSIPAPVYFADLCATRARYHMRSKFNEPLESRSFHSECAEDGEESSGSLTQLTEAVTVHKQLRNQMYFG